MKFPVEQIFQAAQAAEREEGTMFEESGYCDEVIITASGDAYRPVFGKEAVVVTSSRDQDGIWYSAYVPGDRVWKVKACDTVPTGRRVSASVVS